jgi:AcrR family transcriptional regulator
MARTRLAQAERKARTREAVLQAATRLFARRGIEATSLDQVARAAGFSRGAVYANFAGKRALIDAVAERHWIGIDFEPLARRDLSLADRLGLVARGVADLETRLPRELVLLDLEYNLDWLRDPRRQAKARRRYLDNWERLCRDVAAANAERGEVVADDLRELLASAAVLCYAYLRREMSDVPEGFSARALEAALRRLGVSSLERRSPEKPRAGRRAS